uniref:Retrovirus-related Pol polyprotein from transposon TNT 1-94 n=1 Tax=Cajanus cajan TaxID=3821 RepID=A0A151QSR8_CAJCA|nr:hypothetical protein KK1_045844 [Cajanus cajan]
MKRMQVLNLRREFETIKIKESEYVKDFTGILLKVVTQIRFLGEKLSDQRVVNKILMCLLEKFESKISYLEENKDFTQISIAELVNTLQAIEQRRSLRMEGNIEGAFVTYVRGKKQEKGNKEKGWKNKYPPCYHYKKNNHTEYFCRLSQALIVGCAISWIMWRRFVKIKQTYRNIKPKSQSMKNMRNIYLLLFVIQ